MARVLWAREAHRNLSNIGEYLEQVAAQHRSAVLKSIVDATEDLSRFPNIGRAGPEVGQREVRELIVDRYRIFYSVKSDTVTILSIFHSAMDVNARLRALLGDH